MLRLDRLLTLLGVLIGLSCLLATATTFSAPSWLPVELRDFMLAWGPLACVLGVVVIGVTLIFPDLFRGASSRRSILFIGLVALGLAAAAVIILRGCLASGL